MLLTISTTHTPATDLGFLIHKHPDKLQSLDISYGQAHIFYPEASAERRTVACFSTLTPSDLSAHWASADLKALPSATTGLRGVVHGKGLLEPVVKCSGRECRRIIYGPKYTRVWPGVEGLERVVRNAPLRKMHECVFGVLALESAEVDPRL